MIDSAAIATSCTKARRARRLFGKIAKSPDRSRRYTGIVRSGESRRNDVMLYSGAAAGCLKWDMTSERLYKLLDPGSRTNGARTFRAVHHLMLAAGVAIM